MMKQMTASKFKEKCLGILDNLSPDGLVITKHGEPVAKLVPVKSHCADLIGSLKGKIKIKGNILSTGLHWNAQS